MRNIIGADSGMSTLPYFKTTIYFEADLTNIY